jgi:hypothetical protein
MKARKQGFGLVILAALTVPATAAPLPRYGTFVYSSLCIHSESGDLLGARLTLERRTDGDKARFELGEGVLETALVQKVKIEANGHVALVLSFPGVTHQGYVEGDVTDKTFAMPRFLDKENSMAYFLHKENRDVLERQAKAFTRFPVCR